MTLTIEIAPEIERVIEAEAERRGVAVAAIAGEVLGTWAKEKASSARNGTTLTPRQQAARSLYGCLAGRGRTVDDFLRERHEECDREMQAAEARTEAAKARQAEAQANEAAQ